MKLLPLLLLSIFLCTCAHAPDNLTAPTTTTTPGTATLQPWPTDENYWSWDGQTPTLLIGASNHRAPFLAADARNEFNYLIKTGGNYVRTTLPAPNPGPGPELLRPLPDCDDQPYWRSLREYVAYASSRSAAVEIEVWDYFAIAASPWDSSAWNTLFEATLPDSLYRRDHLEGEHPFFQTVPASVAYDDGLLPALRQQEAFVRCLLDHTAAYGNVIYNVQVPDNMLIPWMVYWGRFIEKYGEEKGYGTRVQLGIVPLQRINVAAFNEAVLNGSPLAYHPARPFGNGMSGRALTSIRGVRVLQQHLDFTRLRPAPDLLAKNTGRAQAATDGEGKYAVYLPSSGDVHLSPAWADEQPVVDVTVVGYLGTQRTEVLEPPYEETFRLYTEEEKGGWLLLEPR